jgi:hypothetical protein
MSLIKDNDIVTLRKYVKISFTTTAVKSMPDIDAAERKFLIPILTQEVFDALQGKVDNNDAAWNTLLNICRAAIAPLAVWLDLPFYQASLEDGGLKTTHSDNKQAAHQWEYNRVETALVNKGMAALEDLIEHLLKQGDTYDWEDNKDELCIFRTGTEFSKFVYLNQPNLTFQQLRPLVKEVEDHFIKSAIGDDFYTELLKLAEPKNENKIAIQLIKKAVANYTVVRAVERLPVKITPNGLMATLQDNSEAFNAEAPAKDKSLMILMNSAQREGDAYHVQLMNYVNRTASPEVFETFYDSEFYKPPTTQRIEPNDSRNGVCGLY